MAIDRYLDKMEDALHEAVTMPFSTRRLVDVQLLLELLDSIRREIPQEIKEAKNIVSDRKNILDEANANANEIIQKAEQRARQMISQSEIVKAANALAAETVSTSQRKAKEIEKASLEYTENLLKKSEDALLLVLSEVKNTRLAFRGNMPVSKKEEK